MFFISLGIVLKVILSIFLRGYSVCVCVSMYLQVPAEDRRWHRVLEFSEAGVRGSDENQDGCWEPNFGPLEEQQERLSVEPSLQPSQ